jgi:hypothetical protein
LTTPDRPTTLNLVRRTRVSKLVPLLVAAVGGCSESNPVPPATFDGGFLPRENDRDGDGICNEGELDLGSDPDDPDTDDDEYPDGVEILFGFDALLAASPPRERVIFLRENEASGTQVTVTAEVEGAGEDYAGAFEALDAVDDFGLRADAFYTDSVALFANPDVNVGLVDQERFRGVVGLTRLSFEIRFAFRNATPRLCLRAYPFRYNIKPSNGDERRSGTHLLVVLPVGDDLATGTWCNVPDPCYR